ncbi:MAG TPA: hypothetical protein VFP76_02540 [Gemmatimonadota bacterium]|nr:hypothetical protein [Gemmatimonadota bacterium]
MAMPVPHATETPDRIERRPPGPPGVTPAARIPYHPRRPRPPGRRWLGVALLLAGAAHVLLLWIVRLPAPGPAPRVGEVTVIFEPILPARPETGPAPDAPAEGAEPRAGGPAAEPAPRRAPGIEVPETRIARPRPSEGAPEIRTIPPTTLLAPLTPLEGTPGGIGRRSSPAAARRMAIERAESLLASRLADLPGAGVPREPSVGLAEGGGVTVPIPWGGFVPENRVDRVWREERCTGKDADEADKAGEGEARRSQCD